MLDRCPSCGVEFERRVEKAYFCGACKCWFVQVDGEWHESSEPVTPKDIDPPKEKNVPAPSEPVPLEPEGPSAGNQRSYLGGLITVTEVEDGKGGQ